MKNRIFSVIAVLCLSWISVCAYAIEDIRDPKGILGQTDAFLGNVSFQDAFKCEDKAVYEHNVCSLECKNGDSDCTETCEPPTYSSSTVIVCNPDSVTIESRSGEEISQMALSSATYDYFRGNFLRFFLAELSIEEMQKILGTSAKEGYVEIESIEWIEHVLHNGQSVSGANVFLTLYGKSDENGFSWIMPLSLAIGKNVPVIAQYLQFNLFPGFFKTPSDRLIAFDRK